MPNHTVSGNVDTMMRAADNAAIRTAIGLGQTDAPTFLAQSLTGQSLTGTQATSLVDLAATWNTTGNPSLIYGRVVNTNSGTTANMIDLGTFAGGSLFKVEKTGIDTAAGLSAGLQGVSTGTVLVGSNIVLSASGATIRAANGFAVNLGSADSSSADNFANLFLRSSAVISFGGDAKLFSDAAGILAQRNGTAKQTLRIYNTYTSASIYERAVMDWNGPTPGNLQIGTEFLGSGSGMAARPIDFVTGGVVRMSIAAAGTVAVAGSITVASSITGAGQTGINASGVITIVNRCLLYPPSDGVLTISNNAGTGFTRLEFGATNLGISRGTGSPEGVVTALVGSLYIRTDGGVLSTLYVKESSPTPSTGWVAK